MTDMLDAEEYYYELLRDHEDRFGDVDDATDEALAATAQAAAAAHNQRVCTSCGALQTQPVHGECRECRRAAAAKAAESELPDLEAQIAALEARRDDLRAALDG